jgi:XTP/dITP diphosphohydrolase
MNKLVFATQNPGKIEEMTQLLSGLGIEIVTAAQMGVVDDVEEDQDTFAGNALKKAREIAQLTGEWVVADDSGVCISALNGRPGVFTARWAGEGASDEELVRHTLEQLKDVPEGERAASFHSVAALVAPDGREWTFEGVVSGEILIEAVGDHLPKLPYDVIFKPEGYELPFSLMSAEEKNELSHRGISFRKLAEFIRGL